MTYYESLGGNTTEIDMMDIATITNLEQEAAGFQQSKSSFIGLDQAMETPPIGIQKWIAPKTRIFT